MDKGLVLTNRAARSQLESRCCAITRDLPPTQHNLFFFFVVTSSPPDPLYHCVIICGEDDRLLVDENHENETMMLLESEEGCQELALICRQHGSGLCPTTASAAASKTHQPRYPKITLFAFVCFHPKPSLLLTLSCCRTSTSTTTIYGAESTQALKLPTSSPPPPPPARPPTTPCPMRR